MRFRPHGVDANHVRVAAHTTRILCSDANPYCPAGAADVYTRPLAIEYELIPDGGHLNPDAGYGPWPAVEEWALGG